MGLPIEPWQRQLAVDLFERGGYTAAEVARWAEISRPTACNIMRNLTAYGEATIPPAARQKPGRRSELSEGMINHLLEYLKHKPDLYQEEMATFLNDEFNIKVSPWSVKRALKRRGWSKKVAKKIARERNQELRDDYFLRMGDYHSFQMVFIDESGCDARIGSRRSGWSPRGVQPSKIERFHRGRRVQILPAYTQEGVLEALIYSGYTDAEGFDSWLLHEVLPKCEPWPGKNSVLVMDNASFHRSDRIQAFCDSFGVHLVYLPPYSPDLNPIEEWFGELKQWIAKYWQIFEESPITLEQYLRIAVEQCGSNIESAKAHFRHSHWQVEEYHEGRRFIAE